MPNTVYGDSATVTATSTDPNGPLAYSWQESCPAEGTELTSPETFTTDIQGNPLNPPVIFPTGTVLQDECGLNSSGQNPVEIEPLTQTYDTQTATLSFPLPGKYPVQLTVTDSELSSRPVDQDLLSGFGLGFLAGSFDELAVDEGRSGADEGDQVRCVDHAPVVLG